MFDVESFTNAVENEKMFQLFDIAESLKMDVYARELISGELGRSVKIEIFPNVVLPIVSRADAASAKLIWIDKGSHKSRKDLRQLIARASTIEQDQIARFANDSGLADLLKTVLSEADEISGNFRGFACE